LATLFALGFAAYLIRAFRDLTPHELYPTLIGVIVISAIIFALRPFTGAPASQQYLAAEAAGS
jgi:hypothetical protein